MGYPRTHLAAATAVADVDRFLTVANMRRGTYGAPAASAMPEAGTARHVTLTHLTVAAGTDTGLGVVTITGTVLSGAVITEALTVVADDIVTGVKWFATVTGIVGGQTWVIAGAADTITVGCGSVAIVAEANAGTLYGCQVNTTAAGAITFADAAGTIAVLPSNVAVGTWYRWEVTFTGYLSVALAAGSDITVIHSGSMGPAY